MAANLVKPRWEGRTQFYINGPGHMTKTTAMPIYGKKPSATELNVL